MGSSGLQPLALHRTERRIMRVATLALASTVLMALAGCSARSPVSPVVDTGAAAGDRPFVLTSALEARLPAPMEEARDAGAADMGIVERAPVERDVPHRTSPDPVLFWNGLTTTLAAGAALPPPRFARAYALTHVA